MLLVKLGVMSYSFTHQMKTGTAHVCFTDRTDGDFGTNPPATDIETRRNAIKDSPWSWLHQVHGTEVLTVDSPGAHQGSDGDGLVTSAPGCPISVKTADCAPVVLLSSSAISVVHAGWRGLLGGIIENATSQLEALGGKLDRAILGPCIHASSYEFGEPELSKMVEEFGSSVVSETETGAPALDMLEAVRVACARLGWPGFEDPPNTAGQDWYSHRVRSDSERMATVAWLEE